jgi:hypothetical protein
MFEIGGGGVIEKDLSRESYRLKQDLHEVKSAQTSAPKTALASTF